MEMVTPRDTGTIPSVPASLLRGTRASVPHLRLVAARLPAIALCALAAHGVVYRSVWPDDGAHGYFIVYAPFVAVLSVISLIALPIGLAIALVTSPKSRPVRAVALVLSARSREGTVLTEVARLAGMSLAFLFLQESLERSLGEHGLQAASFSPSTWMLLVGSVLGASCLVAVVGRLVSSLVNVICRSPSMRPRRALLARRTRHSLCAPRRVRPLAVHGGLRAPPLVG
jgi:hypothetical protein